MAMHQLSKSFIFEAAHTLDRCIDAEPSKRIHGHSYRATVTIQGTLDTQGMLMDLGFFTSTLEAMRTQLDHHFLDEVPNLPPSTLERLCVFIWNGLENQLPGLYQVQVGRDMTGDSATYRKDRNVAT